MSEKFYDGTLGESRVNALKNYDEKRKMETVGDFLERLEEIAKYKVSMKDIENESIPALDRKRQKLQIDLMYMRDNVKNVFDSSYNKEAVEFIDDKLSAASGETIVSGKGEELHLKAFDNSGVYNLLAKSYQKLDEAILVTKLLIENNELKDASK